MRLRQKLIIADPQGRRRVVRRYDEAATPLDRLFASGALTDQQYNQACLYRDSINPRQLRRTIMHKLSLLSRMPRARPGAVKDVRDAFIDLNKKGAGLPV